MIKNIATIVIALLITAGIIVGISAIMVQQKANAAARVMAEEAQAQRCWRLLGASCYSFNESDLAEALDSASTARLAESRAALAATIERVEQSKAEAASRERARRARVAYMSTDSVLARIRAKEEAEDIAWQARQDSLRAADFAKLKAAALAEAARRAGP